MAIGALVVAPLGAAQLPLGVVLGLIGAAVGGLLATLLGGARIGISAPGGQVALLVATVVAVAAEDGAPSTGTVVAMVAATGVVAGLTQILIGQLRLGGLIAYLPYPVIAGCGTGAAAVIVLSQVPAFVGLPVGSGLVEWFRFEVWQPGALLAGGTALGLALVARRIHRRLPDVVLGLGGGWAVHALLVATWPTGAGPEIGAIPLTVPDGRGLLALLGDGGDRVVAHLPTVVAVGIACGVLASIVSLVAGAIIEGRTAVRRSANRELLAQGVANLGSGFGGGLPVTLSETRTLIASSLGGTSRAAGLWHAVTILAVGLVLAPVLDRLPVAVLAALLVYGTLRAIDRWVVDLVRLALRHHRGRNRDLLLSLGVVVLVAGITVTVSLFWGLVVGLVVAVVLFIVTMSGSSVRRSFRGDAIRSKRVRNEEAMAVLGEEGRRILVYELQGALFFGTADHLAREVEHSAPDAGWVVLDLKRVTSVDSSAARVIQRLHERLAERSTCLVLSYVGPGLVGWNVFDGLGVLAQLGEDRCFPDTDLALEWCEERLLEQGHDTGRFGRLVLANLAIARDLERSQIRELERYLDLRDFPAGTVVFAEGDPGDELFILLEGEVSVRTRIENGREVRLSSFSPGVVFGEMALLDGSPRSASIVADESSLCLSLSVARFADLGRDHPEIALAVTRNLARMLAERLRRANVQIRALEH